jgi:hypothetical protein
VHVRQFREGKELFDETVEYVDSTTELEAYKHAVREARRLDMTDDKIIEYLKVSWLGEEQVQRLAKNAGVKVTGKTSRGRRARIT